MPEVTVRSGEVRLQAALWLAHWGSSLHRRPLREALPPGTALLIHVVDRPTLKGLTPGPSLRLWGEATVTRFVPPSSSSSLLSSSESPATLHPPQKQNCRPRKEDNKQASSQHELYLSPRHGQGTCALSPSVVERSSIVTSQGTQVTIRDAVTLAFACAQPFPEMSRRGGNQYKQDDFGEARAGVSARVKLG